MASLNDQGITLAGQPIVIDSDGALWEFLDKFYGGIDFNYVFQGTHKTTADETSIASAIEHNSFPDMPPIRPQQYQEPTGWQRESRGLFFMDSIGLARVLLVASKGIDESTAASYSKATLETEFPALFQTGSETLEMESSVFGSMSQQVSLIFNLNETLTRSVYLYPPVRIAFESRQLWLVPVSDVRRDESPSVPVSVRGLQDRTYQHTWQEVLNELREYVFNHPSENIAVTVDTKLGVPDIRTLAGRFRAANVLDSVGFSIGYRYVRGYGLMDGAVSSQRRSQQVAATNIIAGGTSPEIEIEALKFIAPAVPDYYGGDDWDRLGPVLSSNAFHPDLKGVASFEWQNTQSGESSSDGVTTSALRIRCLWNVRSSGDTKYTTEFEDFCKEWEKLWSGFRQDPLDIVYAGLPPMAKNGAIDYLLSGTDDYALIDLGFRQGGQASITTRIVSLPYNHTPGILVNQDPDDLTVYGPVVMKVTSEIEASVAGASETSTANYGTASIQRVKRNSDNSIALLDTAKFVPVKNASTSVPIKPGLYIANSIGGYWWIQPECSEQLEVFEMLSDWIGGIALAQFRLVESLTPDAIGVVEDPLGIFEDQLQRGQFGLSIRTCTPRHFAIQAKCNQTISLPPPPVVGRCCISDSLFGPYQYCLDISEADCLSLLGVRFRRADWDGTKNCTADPCP